MVAIQKVKLQTKLLNIMNRFKIIFSLLIAFAITSCDESSDQDDLIDDGYGSETLLTMPNNDSSELSLIRGLAADGASSIDLLVPVKKSNTDPIITIEPKDEDWGEIEYIGKSTFESTNFNFYRYTLTSEESLPTALESSSTAEITYNIEVSDEQGNSMAAPVTISVIRPAVIFAHGLASYPETYDPMLNYIRPMGLYLDDALFALDYMMTSLASYTRNINVIPEAIEYCRTNLLEAGYINEKFTIVGHSMGGILTRLYIQNEAEDYPYNDDILKIITIDTPHSGSQLADFALTLGGGDSSNPLSIFSNMGAIVDLAVESEATKELNDSAKLSAANALEIPTHVITAHIGTTMDVAQLVKDKQYLFALTTFILNAVEQNLIYGDDSSDLIVPMTSQLGGVEDTWRTNYITTYSNEWHCSVHTTEEAANDIVELFDTESSNDTIFTIDGFAPAVLSYNSGNDLAANFVGVTSRPDISEIASQLIVGLDANGDFVAAAYDNDGDSSFALSDEETEGVVTQLYIAKLNSGVVNYTIE